MKNVIVTGADRGLGLGLCKVFLSKGYRVFAGRFMPEWAELDELLLEYPDALHLMSLDVSSMESVQGAVRYVSGIVDCIDILVNNAGIGGQTGSFGENIDFSRFGAMYSVNSLGPLRMVESFLPYMGNGMKMLCFISSEAGSTAVCSRTEGYAYTMTKAALNMAIRHLHNHLHQEGYLFRVYHPGWLRSYMSGAKNLKGNREPDDSAMTAYGQAMAPSRHEECLQMLDDWDIAWPL